jgi:nucleoside-diphosphate-sugar epimerase
MEKIAVVGSQGFIGKHLKSLISRSSCPLEIVTYDTRASLDMLHGDIKNGQVFSNIVWLATKLNPARAESEKDLVQTELVWIESILKILEEHSNETRFIFPSSGEPCTLIQTPHISKMRVSAE